MCFGEFSNVHDVMWRSLLKLVPLCSQEVVRLLGRIEVLITRAQSLHQKLTSHAASSDDSTSKQRRAPSDADVEKFVSDLLEQPQVSVAGAGHGSLGAVIHNLFRTAQKVATVFMLWWGSVSC